MKTGAITYKTPEKAVIEIVYLDGKKVGEIVRAERHGRMMFMYVPTGTGYHRCPAYGSVGQCKAALEGTDDTGEAAAAVAGS